jgi:hypothetical protein
MSETNTQQPNNEISQNTEPDALELSPRWGVSAPRGGKTVVTRALKDGARVPLFLGQTLIQSLRDLGYNSTTSALCEHIDNALQWGATEVRVHFRQTGKQPNQRIDAMVYDNGSGMAPHVLKVAMAFGGSMVYDNRSGIGRYGMGMKAAALNITRSVDVYSWKEPGAFYSMTLDVDKIGQDRNNMIIVELLVSALDAEVSQLLLRGISRSVLERATGLKQSVEFVWACRLDQVIVAAGDQVIVAAGFAGALAVFLRAIAGQADDVQAFGVALPELPGQVVTAHAGHGEIEDHRVGRESRRPRQRSLAVERSPRLVAPLLQQHPKRGDRVGIVIDDEYAQHPRVRPMGRRRGSPAG